MNTYSNHTKSLFKKIDIENVYSTGFHHQFKVDFFLGHPVVGAVHCYTVVAAPTGKKWKRVE